MIFFMSVLIWGCAEEQVPEILPTVQMSPVESNFDDTLTVTINSEHADTVYYSTDGENFVVYTTPIVLSETTTVYAKAENEFGFSDVVQVTYTKNQSCDGTIVGGVCLIGEQEALYLALTELALTDQFQIHIIIDDGDMNVEADIVYDGENSSFTVGSEEVIYAYNAGVLNTYTKQGDSYVLTSESATTNHLFFLDLSYDQFAFSNELYLLNYNDYALINDFVNEFIVEGTSSNFALSLLDGQVEDIAFDIVVSLSIYHVVMTFTYEDISIVVPTVGGN